MRRKFGLALWSTVLLAYGLFLAQTLLAGSDNLTARLLINVVLTGGVAGALMALQGWRWRDVHDPPPDPANLILGGVAALAVWPVAWWLMNVTDSGLHDVAGALPLPHPIHDLSDSLAGLDLQPLAYELYVLGAVVLLPLAQGWLLWGLVQPELGALVGRWRAAWVAGPVAGLVMTLSAVQDVTLGQPALAEVEGVQRLVLDVAPTLPWGLAAIGGYVLLGCVAALSVYLTGSPWAGFAAHATFMYANLALRDNLADAFFDKDNLSIEWLTLLVIGVFGVFIVLQVMRYRTPRPPEPARPAISRTGRVFRVGLAVALLVLAIVAVAVLDFDARL
jgi:hypothetical protein